VALSARIPDADRPQASAATAERTATFREVFVIREFRALYLASTLSWIGDSLARAAVTALIYQATGSVIASAAGFAISYAPWLVGGPLLVALAERHAYRSVMILCDVLRMAIMGAVAIPDLPPLAILGLLLVAAVLTPPFDAARSAMLPSVLPGDRYVVGLAVHAGTSQPALVTGYLIGAALAAHHPRLALVINAATFGLSAIILRLGVRRREPALVPAHRRRLTQEVFDGFRLVFGTPALRAIALLVFGSVTFAVVPEGLAAAWAADLTQNGPNGWVQGFIMASVPLGFFIGGLFFTRLAAPARRAALIRPFAICAPLALVPAVVNPPAPIVALLGLVCGASMGGLLPAANGLFVQGLPDAFRARAFGVMQAGMQLLQGGAVLVTGLLVQMLPLHLPTLVGLWCMAGVVLMTTLAATWPSTSKFAEARAAANAANTPATA
jgi:MFS family permease